MEPNKELENIGKIERRTFTGEVRMETTGEKRIVEGYAAKFNQESLLMWDFVEIIEPGAFDDVLEDDVRALFNHDPNLVLARNNGSLDLWVDTVGLGYRFEALDTTSGNDLVKNMDAKIINQSSFGFTVQESSWDEIINGDNSIKHIRRIKKIKQLYDVSPVTYPAYTSTEVALRSFDQHKEKSKDQEPIAPNLDLIKAKIKIAKLK